MIQFVLILFIILFASGAFIVGGPVLFGIVAGICLWFVGNVEQSNKK